MDPEIAPLLSQVQSIGSDLPQHGTLDQTRLTRRELRSVLAKLNAALEDPGEIFNRVMYTSLDAVFYKLGIDLKLFHILAESAEPRSEKELAKITGADQTLIGRILRGLASVDAVQEVGDESYVATKTTRVLSSPSGESGVNLFHDLCSTTCHELPTFLAKNKYQVPSNPTNTAFQSAFKTEDIIFNWMPKHPDILTTFNVLMTTQRQGRANWLDFYPIDQDIEQASRSAGKDSVMFVDIGGAVGHEIQALKKRYPTLPGRMVLEDLPDSINQVTERNGMETIVHDFFSPQPIKEARVYYFRSVLHNWADDKACEILQRIASAMKAGYSKLLINDWVVPNHGASVFVTHSDLNMMSLLNAIERTEKQWYDLLGSVGLKISKIWNVDPESESIIEATLA